MKKFAKKMVYPVLSILLGAIIGFAYYRFVGCVSGTCAITGSPILSTGYGAVFGFLIGVIVRPTKRKKAE